MNRLSYLFAVVLLAGMASSNLSFAQSEEEAEDENPNPSSGATINITPGAEGLAIQGNGNQFCEITIVNAGTIHPNIENTALSSKVFGGRAGTVQVTTTNASYSVSIDQPLGFTGMPVGGGDSVNMATFFSGNGATNFSETPGSNQIRLRRGTTLIETHLVASRLSGDPFPTGSYSAQLSLRCE